MTTKRFATALNCIDGRTQLPVIDFVRTKAGVDYVDMVNEAGVVKLLSEKTSLPILESIREQIGISIEKHASSQVWIVAHHDCAANNVEDATQHEQIKKAVSALKEWFPQAQVSGLWLDQNFEPQTI